MATTIYTVFANGTETDVTTTKKDRAVEKALQHRHDTGTSVEVRTGAGTVVFEAAAPVEGRRVIVNKTVPFTRVVKLSDELQDRVPEGYVPAYFRSRANALVLRNEGADAAERYMVVFLDEDREPEFVATCRDAGRAMGTVYQEDMAPAGA